MEDASDRREVREPVKLLPALAAEPLYHLVGGGDGERDHRREGEHADEYETSARNVLHDGAQVEPLVEADVGQQMQRAVEERVEAEHASEAYEPLHARPLPER